MKDQLITLETGKLAISKGINESEQMKNLFNHLKVVSRGGIEALYNAPTQSLLQKWLREVHQILLTVEYSLSENDWFYYLYKQEFNKYIHFKTYEEALEAGLQQGLTLIK